MIKTPFIAAVLLSASLLPAAAASSAVLKEAGFSLPSVELPSPETPKANQWLTLRKITVNAAQPANDDALVGIVRGMDIDKAVKELNENGFKASACQDNTGGYTVIVDVKGQNAADLAVGLARYYYVIGVQVGQRTYDRLFGPGNKSTYAVKQGTIKGGMNNSPVDLKLNKVAWTITGGLNHSPVDVRINHDEKTITGGANLSPVDLKFDWSTREVKVHGGANHSPVNYTVNWDKGLLEGHANNSPLRLEFSRQDGFAGPITSIKGYANHAPVDLTFNGVNGHLGGGLNHAPVDVNLVNCDIYDFLQYFFLFLNNPAL